MILHDLIDAYWSWAVRNLAPSTVDSRLWLLTTVQDYIPRVDAEKVTPLMVEEWLARSGIRNPSTANTRITALSAVFNWGVDYRLIASNPISRMSRPTANIREFFIPPDRFQDVLDAAPNNASRDLITFLLDTGCRSQEIIAIRKEYWDGDLKITLPRKDSKGKKSRRVIFLGHASREVMVRATEAYPEGSCLRTFRGAMWNRGSLYRLTTHLTKKLGWHDLVITTFRHSFAHAKLSAGVSPEVVATLMGHKSTDMIYTRYGHLIHSPLTVQSAGVL